MRASAPRRSPPLGRSVTRGQRDVVAPRERVDVDDARRTLDAELHEIDERRAAGDEARAWRGAGTDGAVEVGGA